MYKVGDVIQHPAGGAKFRIVLIEEDQNAYKVYRIDNHQIVLIGMDKGYVLATAPEETMYQPGQVLIKKEGSPRIGVVWKACVGADGRRHTYDVYVFTPQGELQVKYAELSEEEIQKQFEISNFKWVVLYGDPRKLVRKALQKRVDKLQQQLDEETSVLESLTYYDTLLQQAGINPNPVEEEELGPK